MSEMGAQSPTRRTRRGLLAGGGALIAAGTSLAACGQAGGTPAAPLDTTRQVTLPRQ
jgi:hypothetical protein